MEFLSICFITTVNQIATSSKNFKNFKKLHLYIWCFSPCYRNLPRRICSCACISWLFQFAFSAYYSLYKYQGFIQAIFMSVRRHKKLNLLIEFSNWIFIKFFFKAYWHWTYIQNKLGGYVSSILNYLFVLQK